MTGDTVAKLLPDGIISDPILLLLYIIIFNEIKPNNEIESDTFNEEYKNTKLQISDKGNKDDARKNGQPGSNHKVRQQEKDVSETGGLNAKGEPAWNWSKNNKPRSFPLDF